MSKYNDAQKRAIMRYEKTNLKRYVFKVDIHKEADMIAFLDSLESVQGEVKRLIREEMKKR